MTNKTSLAALVVAVVALGFAIFGGGKTTEVIRETVKEIVGAAAGGDFQFPVTFYDRVIRANRLLATTTPQTLTGHTLVAADFQNPHFLRVVTLGGAADADYTFTLPASSTVGRAVVPNVGDREEMCFFVQATSSKSGLIITPGTGWDLTVATTTLTTVATSSVAAVRTIEQNQIGCLDMIREPGIGLQQVGNINAEIRFRVNANDTTND